ncbi:hypothetical protein [Acinetobacter sp. YH16053]|uniref:hypothetical protein n=1 Tax=Acinetobacter sp. YH16053 TaxID=2601192 RepID=UPI0015D13EE6|nr:hypothetical protein [Acinetobacter sp. YH16053]
MSDKDNKFSLKFLGVVMEAMNLNPDNFVKIFWNVAFIVAFLMVVNFILKTASHYLGM